MANTIKLTPDELRTSAAKYGQFNQDVQTLISSASTEQENIRSNWEGNAFEKFDQQFNDLKPKMQDFAQLMEDIQSQLNKVADIIEQTDSDIASQIGQ
jgi:WXG100 family type VII secretion target